MPVKLIALDMDGTSLLPDQSISPSVQHAIFQAQQQGILVLFASGRWHNMMKDFYPIIKTQGPQINCNGSTIIDTQGHIITKTAMHADNFKKLVSELNDYKIAYGACDEFNMYSTEYTQSIDPLYRVNCLTKNNIEELSYAAKITAQNVGADFRQYIADTYRQFQVAGAEEGHIEIWPHDASKGLALRQVAEYYGIAMEDTLAVGDGANDVAMLQLAGIGVAMGQGGDEAKRAADVVAPNLDDDGVAWAINTYALKK